MFPSILDLVAVVRVFFVCRSNLAVEMLALRQQVSVLKRKRQRPKLNRMDRLFWIVLRRLWSHWTEVLVIVKPRPWSGGIAPDSGCIDVGGLADPPAAGPRCLSNSGN